MAANVAGWIRQVFDPYRKGSWLTVGIDGNRPFTGSSRNNIVVIAVFFGDRALVKADVHFLRTDTTAGNGHRIINSDVYHVHFLQEDRSAGGNTDGVFHDLIFRSLGPIGFGEHNMNRDGVLA